MRKKARVLPKSVGELPLNACVLHGKFYLMMLYFGLIQVKYHKKGVEDFGGFDGTDWSVKDRQEVGG